MKSAAKVMAFWIFIQFQIGYSLGQNGAKKLYPPLTFTNLKTVGANTAKENPLGHKSQRIVVLICLSEICMVSRYYAQEMQTLYQKYGSDSVFFGGFFPNPFSSSHAILDFSNENKLGFPLYQDSIGTFSRAHSITTTPEVLVFKDGRKVFQGRIDDFYVAVGRHKGFTRMRFLENAISRLLKNELPEKSFIPPIGCAIDFRLWDK